MRAFLRSSVRLFSNRLIENRLIITMKNMMKLSLAYYHADVNPRPWKIHTTGFSSLSINLLSVPTVFFASAQRHTN